MKKVLVAFGGNALLRAGQKMSGANQLANVRIAARSLARLKEHRLLVTHGNGPQSGYLASLVRTKKKTGKSSLSASISALEPETRELF